MEKGKFQTMLYGFYSDASVLCRKSSDAINIGYWPHAKDNEDGYQVGSSIWTRSDDGAKTNKTQKDEIERTKKKVYMHPSLVA
jgi:hypothetical protein